MVFLRKRITKGVILEQKGTRMSEDGQDWNGSEITILKSLANFCKKPERWRSSFQIYSLMKSSMQEVNCLKYFKLKKRKPLDLKTSHFFSQFHIISLVKRWLGEGVGGRSYPTWDDVFFIWTGLKLSIITMEMLVSKHTKELVSCSIYYNFNSLDQNLT